MKNKSLLFCFIYFYFLLLNSSAGAQVFTNKILKISGTSSFYGKYEGQLELRLVNQKIIATKVFTYQKYKFENLAVQEVWTGEVTEENNQLVMVFNIRQADYINQAEGFSRSPEMFKENILITQRINLKDRSTLEKIERGHEIISETVEHHSLVSSAPLWENLRTNFESYGNDSSSLIKLGTSIVGLRVFNWFHSDPLVKAYENREEYKSKKQYFVFDPTDYEFYQSNPGILRVVNKVPDTIALIEDIQRRNAYAPTLDEKARHFDFEMKQFFINELGLYSTAVFDSQGKFVRYVMVGDGCLWTGMYLASQAMRYEVTGEKVALDNVKKSLKGLMLLMDITDDPKTFARNAATYDGTVEPTGNYRRGSGNHQDKVWRAIGNNDMYKGLIHGFIWAYKVLPENDELRGELYKHMSLLPELEVANSMSNKSSAYGLKALATKSLDDKKIFLDSYRKEQLFSEILNLEGSLHVGGIADWSGVNLTMIGITTDLLIAKSMMKDFPQDAGWSHKSTKSVYHDSMKNLMLLWKDLSDTRRNLLTIAAYHFAIKDGFKLENADEYNDDFSKEKLEKVWKNNLLDAVWGLREIPINRSRYDITCDYSLRPDWSLSWWPKLPWKSVKEKKPIEYHMQGAFAYPLFESSGIGSNFVWKDQPFEIRIGSQKTMRDPGADYLYTYWMAKSAGILSNQ